MGEFIVMAPALGAMVAAAIAVRTDRVAASNTARLFAIAVAVAGAAVFSFCAYLVLFVHAVPL